MQVHMVVHNTERLGQLREALVKAKVMGQQCLKHIGKK